MKTVLITGGTGLVGSRLTELLLARNYNVIVLSRSKKETSTANLSYAIWNVEEQIIDVSVFAKTDYIYHLLIENNVPKYCDTEHLIKKMLLLLVAKYY